MAPALPLEVSASQQQEGMESPLLQELDKLPITKRTEVTCAGQEGDQVSATGGDSKLPDHPGWTEKLQAS
jgi:hypothetical protein